MSNILRFGIVSAILGLISGGAAWSQSKAGVGPWLPVKDDLNYFSAKAKEQANQTVAEIKRLYNKDLLIETALSPKDYNPKDFDATDKVGVDRFFQKWAEHRYQVNNVRGIYVGILDSPKQIRVQVGDDTRSKNFFTAADSRALFDKIKEHLKANDKDGALTSATSYVLDSMRRNHPAAVVAPKAGVAPVAHQGGHGAAQHEGGFPWSSVLTIGAVLVGVWLLFSVLRALLGGMSGGGAPGMGGGGGGGGGFMTSLLGGMFGAAAGMWMYNHFLGGGGSSAWGAGPGDNGGSMSDPNSGDASSAGTGGDYGDDAGGGGGGGGDWGGGGDAGGGDWGGGGGDFGGGGGGGDW